MWARNSCSCKNKESVEPNSECRVGQKETSLWFTQTLVLSLYQLAPHAQRTLTHIMQHKPRTHTRWVVQSDPVQVHKDRIASNAINSFTIQCNVGVRCDLPLWKPRCSASWSQCDSVHDQRLWPAKQRKLHSPTNALSQGELLQNCWQYQKKRASGVGEDTLIDVCTTVLYSHGRTTPVVSMAQHTSNAFCPHTCTTKVNVRWFACFPKLNGAF